MSLSHSRQQFLACETHGDPSIQYGRKGGFFISTCICVGFVVCAALVAALIGIIVYYITYYTSQNKEHTNKIADKVANRLSNEQLDLFFDFLLENPGLAKGLEPTSEETVGQK